MGPSMSSSILALLALQLPCLSRFGDCHDTASHNTHPHQCGNQYSRQCNNEEEDLSDEVMFHRGHLKPFGSHRPPDEIVEQLPYMISPEDFYMSYVVKHKPVVLKGAVKYWPAYKKWTDDYLNQTYGNETFHMETKDDNKWNIPPDMKLRDFLGKYKQSNRYLVDEVLPDMRRDVVLPLCLRCEEMSSYFFVSYFWMSMGGTSSSIHLDTDENLLCVIRGHKVVHMVSPVYSRYLYADESRLLGVSDINPQAVDMDKYPDFVKVRYVTAIVEEGDVVYIPQMWWHQVISRPERQQAIALWWKSKPWLKMQGRKAVSLEHDDSKLGSLKADMFSYSRVLAQYELWVQNVSALVPRIECKAQRTLMSDYRFETDKVENAPRTLGDGGDIEEEAGWTIGEMDAALHERHTAHACHFDRTNEKSPCHYRLCLENDEDKRCIRYVLDYCFHYEDRGCVVELPALMNKLSSSAYGDIKQMASEFVQS